MSVFCSISNCIWWENNEEAYISPNLVGDGYGSWNRKKITKHIHRFIKKQDRRYSDPKACIGKKIIGQ